jgi:hypothetical protein
MIVYTDIHEELLREGRYKHTDMSRYSPLFHILGFEVLTAVSMKMAVFWVVAP